jgi:deoxyribonuclease V
MQIHDLHPWDISPGEAVELQSRLRQRLSLEDGIALGDIRVVAGVDNAYVRAASRTTACSAVVALRFPSLELVETHQASVPVQFPYIPGLLAFRELPAMLAALRQLAVEPDVVLADAHGYAHPRRMGAAAHLGLLLDRPTIGCAKSRLVGRHGALPQELGAHTPLLDRGEVVGAVVRTRPHYHPLFVSPGHKMSVATAVAIALACSRGRSIMPEPTRLADALTKEAARRQRERAADEAPLDAS